MIGRPPWIGRLSGNFIMTGRSLMRSSQALVARRVTAAVRAFAVATSAVIGPAPSRRSRYRRKPASSTMAMLTFHLFFWASARQAPAICWTSDDVRAGLLRIAAASAHEAVELRRVVAGHLPGDVGRQMRELVGDVLAGLRP